MTDVTNNPERGNIPRQGLGIDEAVKAILKPQDSDAVSRSREVTMDESPADEGVTGKVTTQEAATRSDNRADHAEDTEAVTEQVTDDVEEPEQDEDEGEEEVQAQSTEEETEEPEAEEEKETNPVLFTSPEGDEITLEEAQRGYLRQADYTKKTQAVSELKQQVQQRNEQLGSEQQVLAQNLAFALDIIEPQLSEYARTDWNALATADPYEYAEKRALFDQAQIRYNHVVQASQQLVAQQKAQSTAQQQQRLKAEGNALAMALPELSDPKKAPALRNSLREYAIASGLTQQEAGSITDHRMVLMMNKARMFDEMSASGIAAAKKKLSHSPKKVVKAGQPITRTEKNQAATNKRRSNLKNSGSVDDAVAFIMGR